MKTYKKLYEQIISKKNLLESYKKARKGKSKKEYVKEFDSNYPYEISKLYKELKNKTYLPSKLNKFIVRDPKTRTIHSSKFRDRIVHHAIVNILNTIYDKIFICDSFASRKNKGTHNAVKRFEYFVNKVSKNGTLTKKKFNNNSIKGFILKADFKHYFDTIDHEVLINILRKKIDDEETINLIKLILYNFETEKGKGLPLGNYTSQFFANIYLNELDYYIKHTLKVRYYIRYVDDFVIVEEDKRKLEYYLEHIKYFLPCLKLKLHENKTKISPLRNGVTFLGYRVFYNYKLLRKRNIKHFLRRLEDNLELYNKNELTEEQLKNKLSGWFGYAKFANTYNFRKKIISDINRKIYKPIITN